MSQLVFWNVSKYTLEEAVANNELQLMANSIHGSNLSYTLDCVDAAQSVGELLNVPVGVALQQGDQYINLQEDDVSEVFYQTSFDCPSHLFDDENWNELIRVYKKAE